MNATALRRGLLVCGACALPNAPSARHAGAGLRCARCGARLHARKPYSVQRCWALVLAAYVLYLPANLLPILETGKLGQNRWDTIPSGVLELMRDGAWPLALVILVASILVPLAKLVSLTYLLISVQAGTLTHRRARTNAWRLLDFIGRWSLVDIYVGALLVGLVRFEPLAAISPGPGAIAFGAVVVLTMFASRSFDPRLIWDAGEPRPGARRYAHG
jgi:paraquat-inducible protein A